MAQGEAVLRRHLTLVADTQEEVQWHVRVHEGPVATCRHGDDPQPLCI